MKRLFIPQANAITERSFDDATYTKVINVPVSDGWVTISSEKICELLNEAYVKGGVDKRIELAERVLEVLS